MPKARKKMAALKSSKSSDAISYDGKLAITLICLFLAYPLGLIFMWLWMKTWPTWLRVVVTLPLIISVFFMMVVFYFLGVAIRHGALDDGMYRRQMMRNNWQNIYLTPSSTPQAY